jgi:hypothetical protein
VQEATDIVLKVHGAEDSVIYYYDGSMSMSAANHRDQHATTGKNVF